MFLVFNPCRGTMALFAIIIFLSSLLGITSSVKHNSQFILPNFTASYYQFVDSAGDFLFSRNGTFKASISSLNQQQNRQQEQNQLQLCYFSIVHSSSNTIIWTANRYKPFSVSSRLLLTLDGLVIIDDEDSIVWSTPMLSSSVAVMQLDESGNLLLLDQGNVSLWESFHYPTDTLVMGQRLLAGVEILVGDYRLLFNTMDASLQWNEMTYWKLSMDNRAFKDSNQLLSFMSLNASGLYLFGDEADGSRVVFQVPFDASASASASAGLEFLFARLQSNGKFIISSYNGGKQVLQFPTEDCSIPYICGSIGLCSNAICSSSCPPAFHYLKNDCVPIDPLFTLAKVCNAINGSKNNNHDSYLKIRDGIDYFATDFIEPLNQHANLSYCQHLCSQSCSCLGILHENSSGSCYPIQNRVGTFGQGAFSGYIKTVSSNINSRSQSNENTGAKFSAAGLVLLSSAGVFLFIVFLVVGFLWWRRRKRHSKTTVVRLGSKNSSSTEEIEIASIPGLPVRFKYEEIAAATENFKTQIGSGGFGTVYKGTLPDRSVVAVKKMTNSGIDRNKDFCTEIAIIGSIHHVNLVKLTGFCVQGMQRFLVYEYMNRGSLDQAIFNAESVVEWKERFEIALGIARGLSYLHRGCQHKIIHCDVKPENILLHDNLKVKISDFGISKLLTPEQSNLLTTLRGTRGYIAPEWLTSHGISDKSDVYSYGMVLLEIVRGRRNASSTQKEESDSSSTSSSLELQRTYFPQLALEMHEQERYMELADPRLEGRVESEEVEKLVRVALCCLHLEPRLRPTMSNVVGMLEGTLPLPLGYPRIQSLHHLRIHGQRFAEAVTTSMAESNEFILHHHSS